MFWDRIEKIASQRRSQSDVIAIGYWGNSLFVGRNSLKTSPRFQRRFPDKATCYRRHAEMDLLNRLPLSTNLRDLTVYVMRWRKDGRLSMSMPCDACAKRLRLAGVRPSNIHYTDWSGDWRRMK